MSASFNFGWNERENNAAPWGGHFNGNAERDSVLDTEADQVCNYVRKQIRIMTNTVRKVSRNHMPPSAAQLLKDAASGEGGTLLHGSDVPKKTKRFEVVVIGFRLAPEGFQGSIGLLDLKPVFDCEAWALNKTNFKAVAKIFGDNTDKWKGKLKLEVIQVRNPKTGSYGPSLAVAQ